MQIRGALGQRQRLLVAAGGDVDGTALLRDHAGQRARAPQQGVVLDSRAAAATASKGRSAASRPPR